MSLEPLVLVGGEHLFDLTVDEHGRIAGHPGGAPANVARGVARLGGRSALVARVSDDVFGRRWRAVLADDGVDARGLGQTTLPTGLAVAEIDGEGAARYRFHLHGTSLAALDVDDALDALPLDPSALYVGGLALGLEPVGSALEALAAAVPEHVVVVIDPNCRPGALPRPEVHVARFGRLLPRADIIKVSVEDLALLAPRASPRGAAMELVRSGAGCVLVTDGARDVDVVTRDGSVAVPAPPAVVRDTIGAGDAFCSAVLRWWTSFGLARAATRDIRQLQPAVEWAAHVAALACERSGAEGPTAEEVALPAAPGPTGGR